MREKFEKIYAEKLWGGGSGEGSRPVNNSGYVSFLEKFLKEKSIASVVDLGCGDWQFSRNINWGTTTYHGFDLVPSVIAHNRKTHASESISFSQYSGDFADLPPADLLIAKDVLQHWSHDSINRFLPVLSRYKYALLTNCVNPAGETVNADIQDGDFRYLDLRLPPFGLNAVEVFHFWQHRSLLKVILRRPRWLKRVLLVQTGRPS